MPPAALPHGAPRLTHDEYYARAREFRAWLEEHDRYLDEMSRDDARRYFGRFVRRWNDGRLHGRCGADADRFYAGRAEPVHHTRYRWAFAERARSASPDARAPRPLPAAERQYEREREQEAARRAAQSARRHARREVREWADEHAPRATGREAVHERRREIAASNRAMAERREVDDDVGDAMSTDALLGLGGSFQEAYVVC